jgi:hypothetical protein
LLKRPSPWVELRQGSYAQGSIKVLLTALCDITHFLSSLSTLRFRP